MSGPIRFSSLTAYNLCEQALARESVQTNAVVAVRLVAKERLMLVAKAIILAFGVLFSQCRQACVEAFRQAFNGVRIIKIEVPKNPLPAHKQLDAMNRDKIVETPLQISDKPLVSSGITTKNERGVDTSDDESETTSVGSPSLAIPDTTISFLEEALGTTTLSGPVPMVSGVEGNEVPPKGFSARIGELPEGSEERVVARNTRASLLVETDDEEQSDLGAGFPQELAVQVMKLPDVHRSLSGVSVNAIMVGGLALSELRGLMDRFPRLSAIQVCLGSEQRRALIQTMQFNRRRQGPSVSPLTLLPAPAKSSVRIEVLDETGVGSVPASSENVVAGTGLTLRQAQKMPFPPLTIINLLAERNQDLKLPSESPSLTGSRRGTKGFAEAVLGASRALVDASTALEEESVTDGAAVSAAARAPSFEVVPLSGQDQAYLRKCSQLWVNFIRTGPAYKPSVTDLTSAEGKEEFSALFLVHQAVLVAAPGTVRPSAAGYYPASAGAQASSAVRKALESVAGVFTSDRFSDVRLFNVVESKLTAAGTSFAELRDRVIAAI